MNTLAYQTTLESEVIRIPEAARFVGKEVLITVVELEEKTTPKPRTWRHLGTVNLGQQADGLNLRDLAYE
jgi:virulence-associated protein VagC